MDFHERAERTQMVMVMVLAAMQADGKSIEDLSAEEVKKYVDSAVADFKLAVDTAAK